MFAQQLEFDFEFGCPSIDAEYYREGAQDLIQRLVPSDLLENTGMFSGAQRARFADLLPLIVASDLSKAPSTFSMLLLCKYRLNACNFFYDMISRWLLPQKRVNVELFFASDVRLPHLSDDLLSVAEIVIYLKSAQDVEEVKRNFHVIETEIRLGVVSNYHARRILEFKGLSLDGKTAMIQEKIGSLIQSHSKDFDRGIFTQMQQFLVTCHDEFKKERDYHHISRIISNLYSLRKLLKQTISSAVGKRHVLLKFLKTRLSTANAGQSKPVLGILMGMNFLQEHEVFDIDHLIAVIHSYDSTVRVVPNSPFLDKDTDDSMQTLYLEIEKQDGKDFSLDEVQNLRTCLPDQIKSNVERLTHPIFMPRNEEEVFKNILTLAKEIRFVNDTPQVILSFEGQQGSQLCFTVILVRIKGEKDPSIQELFARAKTDLRYIPDRIRPLGLLRRRHRKEATVFRLLVASQLFLRLDRSIDFYKARQFVLNELIETLGDLRDYNGGMIYKQNELLHALSASLGKFSDLQKSLIETFFYALMPMEMRAVLEAEPLKQFFQLFLQARKTYHLQKKNEAQKLMVIAVLHTDTEKKAVEKKIEALSIPSRQLASFCLELDDRIFMGYLLFSEDPEYKARLSQQF
jgi:hypothetical protein